jgi:hypothetical protein
MAAEQPSVALNEFHALLSEILAGLEAAKSDPSAQLDHDSIKQLAHLTNPSGTASGRPLIDGLEPLFPDRWLEARPEIVKMWFQCLNEKNIVDLEKEKLRNFLKKIYGNLPAIIETSTSKILELQHPDLSSSSDDLSTLSLADGSFNDSPTRVLSSGFPSTEMRSFGLSSSDNTNPEPHPQKKELLRICDAYLKHLRNEFFAEYYELRCAGRTEQDMKKITSGSVEQEKAWLHGLSDSDFVTVFQKTQKGAKLSTEEGKQSFKEPGLQERNSRRLAELGLHKTSRSSDPQAPTPAYWKLISTELTEKYETMLAIKSKIKQNDPDVKTFITNNQDKLATHRNSKLERFFAAAAAFMFIPGFTNLIIKGITGYWFGGLYTSKGEQACNDLLNILEPKVTFTSKLCR